MPNQLNSIVEELKQNTLSIDDIEKHELTKEELFEVKIGSVIIGPYSEAFLKAFADKKNLMEFNVLIKTMESILWVPILQHPSFLATDEDSVTDAKRISFYILVNGRKVGPYRIEDIDFKVANNEVLFTDLVSEDAGVSWKKLYEVDGFDLRRHSEEELPSAPEGQILEDSRQEIEKGEKNDPLGDLAKIGHQKSQEKQKLYATPDIQEDKNLGRSLINIATFVGIIFITIFVFDKIDPFGPEETARPPKKVSAKATTTRNERTPRKKTPTKAKEEASPASVRRMEEKKARRKKAIAKRKKPSTAKAKTAEEDPYPENDDFLDEEPEDYYDDETKPKKKKTVKKAKTKKRTDDDYYDEEAEEDDPY
ncbi:MAG: hypothetical protein E2O68_08435 [Deltaproteobacteria bacterium]|nr:MAG: hypothetical protein E2O68_08435 [Deltaproteobacteria bacterium]